jgi:hypothetical protein
LKIALFSCLWYFVGCARIYRYIRVWKRRFCGLFWSQLLPWLLYYYSSLLGLLLGILASYEVSKEVAKIHKFRLVISFLFMLWFFSLLRDLKDKVSIYNRMFFVFLIILQWNCKNAVEKSNTIQALQICRERMRQQRL